MSSTSTAAAPTCHYPEREGKRWRIALLLTWERHTLSPAGCRRCNETLAILFGDVPYEVVRDFREIDFGAFEMKSYEMLKDEPAYQAWLSRDPEINPPPGGESGEQMTRRVLAAYMALESRKENHGDRDPTGGVIAA